MSRRKQANPKSIKDATENKITNSTTLTELETSKINQNKRELEQDDVVYKPDENPHYKKIKLTDNFNEENQNVEVEDEINEKSPLSSPSSSHLLQNNEDNKREGDHDIDVETFSENDETEMKNHENDEILYSTENEAENSIEENESANSPSSTKENNINSTAWGFNLSPSPALSSSSSTSSSPSQLTKSTPSVTMQSSFNLSYGLKNKNEEDTLKNKQNQLNNEDANDLNKKVLSSNGKVNQQRSAPIVVNGKKYFPLIFNCADCGVRYSDKGALMTHQKNYCTKRSINDNKDNLINISNNNNSPTSSSDSSESSANQIKTSNSESNQQNEIVPMKEVEANNESLIQNTNNEMINHNNFENSNNTNNNNNNNSKALIMNDLNLVKTEIYQCNYCNFTTDKKPAMNRHSRVHLPEKRREIEELNNKDTNELTSDINSNKKILTKLNDRKQNEGEKPLNSSVLQSNSDSNRYYCNECDIPYSSLNTFLHHKSFYCKKFKKIEAIVSQNAFPPTNTRMLVNVAGNTKTSNESLNETQTNKNSIQEKLELNKDSSKFKTRSPINSPIPSAPAPQPFLNEESNVNNNKFKHLPNSQLLAYQNNIPRNQPINQHFDNKCEVPVKAILNKLPTNTLPGVSSSPATVMPSISIPSTNRFRNNLNSGEVVYVPVYIPNNNNNNTNTNNNNNKTNSIGNIITQQVTEQHVLNYRHNQIPNITPLQFRTPIQPVYPNQLNSPLKQTIIRNINPNLETPVDTHIGMSTPMPLDLRLNSNESKPNNENSSASNSSNGPLDLSIKSKDVTKKSNDTLPQPKSPQLPNFICEYCNIRFQNNDLLNLHKLNECGNRPKLNRTLSLNNNEINYKNESTIELNFCKNCHQNFSNYKAFQLHNCNRNEMKSNEALTHNEDVKVYFQCKLCINQPHFQTQEKYIEHLNNLHQNETFIVKQTSTSPLASSSPATPLITNPSFLVSNTKVKKYYFCKTCGYRGHTERGVKQHGKSHLSNKEPFDILEATSDEIDKIKIIKTAPKEYEDVRLNGNKITTLNNKTQIINEFENVISEPNDNTKISRKRTITENENNNDSLNNSSFEKKRQCIDNHNLSENDESDTSDSYNTYNQNFLPQTYCTTCKIHFKQEHNFTAHKKFYCKETTSTNSNSERS